MGDDRVTLKLDSETHETLKSDKPDGVTWDYYLDELHRKAYAWDNRGSDVL